MTVSSSSHSHSWFWNRHSYCFPPSFSLSFTAKTNAVWKNGGMDFSPLPLSHYSGFLTVRQVSRSLAAYSKKRRRKKGWIMTAAGVSEQSKLHTTRCCKREQQQLHKKLVLLRVRNMHLTIKSITSTVTVQQMGTDCTEQRNLSYLLNPLTQRWSQYLFQLCFILNNEIQIPPHYSLHVIVSYRCLRKSFLGNKWCGNTNCHTLNRLMWS